MGKEARIMIRLLLCAFMFTGCAGTGTGAATEQAAVEATAKQAAVEETAEQETAEQASPEHLPEGSELKVIPGGSHILLYEKNCYKEFQDDVVRFLLNN